MAKLASKSNIFLLLLFLAFSPDNSFCSELDSLSAVWHDESQPDSLRLNAMWRYSSRRWLKCTHDSLFLMGEQMQALAIKSGSMWGQSFGLRNQVFARLYSRDYDECERLLIEKMQIDSARENSHWVATNYSLLAEVQMKKFNYPQALILLDKSFDLWVKMGNKNKQAFITNYKGNIYKMQGDYLKALQYYKEAVEIAKSTGKMTSISLLYKANVASVIAEEGNYKEALTILFEILEELKKNDRNIYVAMVSQNIGEIFSTLGKYKEARPYYDKYIEVYTEMHMPDAVARAKLSIANDLVEQGKYVEALDLYEQSLIAFEKVGRKESIALAYNRIGFLNFQIENYQKALAYYNKVLDMLGDVGYENIQASTYRHIGQVYDQLNNYENSLEYYFKCLAYNQKIGHKNAIADVYRDLGVSFKAQGDYEASTEFLTKSRKIREEMGVKRGMAEVYIDIGSLMFAKNQFDEGLFWCEKGYDLALNIGVLKLEMEASNCLYKANKKLGNGLVALEYYEKYLSLKDSLNTSEADRKIQQMEFDKQRAEDSLVTVEDKLKTELAHESSLIKEKNTRNTFMFAGLGILLIAVGLFGRMRYIRRTNKKLEEKNQLIAREKERAEASEKAKEQFFDNVSHEFRTPLTLILGPVEAMIKENPGEGNSSDLHIIQRNALRLRELVDELLDLSKLEFGKIKLQASEQNIVKITHEYLQSFESLADQEGISLVFKSQPKDVKAFIDVGNYHKILTNLLSNALKFTKEGGEVSVSVGSRPPIAIGVSRQSAVGSPQSSVEINVSDNGIGIPHDKLPHIFDRFYQVGEHATSHQPGTGIGLALTKELVELNHGTIEAESEPGSGTTFTILLPAGKEHLSDDEIADVEETEQLEVDQNLKWQVNETISGKMPEDEIYLKNGNPILLIVDDNPDMRIYIKNHLDAKYKIIEASDGEEAFQKALNHIPDLIISDLMMPKMDGYQLTEKLKSDLKTSHIPIILLTARASVESKIAGLETGVDAYVTKPFSTKELNTRVSKLIEQRQKLREHFSKTLESQDRYLVRDPQLPSLDQKFVQKALDVVNDHLSDVDFDALTFAGKMALSRVQLHRKIKALTNKTTSDFVRTVRLNKAAGLLRNKTDNVTQIAYETGFSSLSWFAKSFKKQFGVTPSEYNNLK